MKLNMDAATSFVRVMKKLLHLISIPTSILKSHVQDADIQALDKQVVLQAIKLRGDYYRSDEGQGDLPTGARGIVCLLLYYIIQGKRVIVIWRV